MKTDISRREFLKKTACAALSAGSLATIASCGKKKEKTEAFETEGEMTYRIHPENGDKVSLLGYGCMRWPMNPDGKTIDQETTNRLVDFAIDHGVNYFDTAPVYLQGHSETATGIALKRHPRKSYYIATKLSNFSNHSRENSLKMYHKSFENLQTEYIDYYLLHSIGRGGMDDFNARYVDNGMLDFLMEERKAGRIRNLGFSFHGDAKTFDEFLELHDKYHWDFVQIQLNYVDWNHASGENADASYLQAELEKRNIPSIIMEPLLGGRLSKVSEYIATRLKSRNPEVSVASWAFRFAGTPKGVLCVLSGMTYMEHLQDNLKTYSPLKPLTEEDIEFLDETAELMENDPTIPCNDCKYCMPCPYGIDIPAILMHYNKCVIDGNIVESIYDSDYSRARRAYLVSYDRAVPKLRQAERCIGCGKCKEHCPQKINIPTEIRKIDNYIEGLRTDTLGTKKK